MAIDRTVVFVHGINSKGPETFAQMQAYFEFAGWPGERLQIYSYEFNDPIRTNGKRLADFLNQHYQGTDVVLVCHSMGGLVARLAVLEHAPLSVVMLIMLATPNFGALQDTQIGQLMQPLFRAGRAFIGWRPRKPGIRDLMLVPSIFGEVFDSGASSTDVDYVTIPGTFFHQLRSDWDVPDQNRMGALFTSLNLAAGIGVALAPLFAVALPKPHDGIVTERSNKFVPVAAGYDAEKNASINRPASIQTYAHVRPPVSTKLHHCNITHDDEIAKLVLSLASAPSLEYWLDHLPPEYSNLTIEPPPRA